MQMLVLVIGTTIFGVVDEHVGHETQIQTHLGNNLPVVNLGEALQAIASVVCLLIAREIVHLEGLIERDMRTALVIFSLFS